MSRPVRETFETVSHQMIGTGSAQRLPQRITETVQCIKPASPRYQFQNTALARGAGPVHPKHAVEQTVENTVRETVVSHVLAGPEYPGSFPQVIRKPPERPVSFLPLDRIHENGHPDITRFTTEEFKVFHDYLTKSTEDGRSFRGSGQIDNEDIVNKQEKTLEGLKTQSFGTNLGTLLSLCQLSNLREKKCVDFITEAGFNELFTDILIAVRSGDVYVNDQINHPSFYIAFNLLLDAAQRFTEIGHDLCRQMGKEVVPLLLDIVRDTFFDVEALNRDDEERKWMSRRELLKKMFTLLYNCIRNYPDNRGAFRRNMASDILKPFLDCRFYILREKALFILAYIVTEEENVDLNTTSLNIEFIVKILRRALEDPSHYSAHYNFFAVEVVEAVQRVAANDDNKDKFIEAGVLPHLINMMGEKNSKEERTGALQALWVLSFTKQYKSAILDEKDCIDNVRACLGVDDYTQTCQAILWNLQGQVSTRPKVKTVEDKEDDEDDKPEETGKDGNGSNAGSVLSDRTLLEKESKVTPKRPAHVMISYQWDVQKQILKVKDILKAHGFNVWLDVERMGGSTLDAMANAVEEACVVIICFSEKYKDSPACRTEAEYTYKLGKPIIPLKMQTGYDPNGWLGAMLGTKFYIQMNNLELVQENMRLLLRELADRGRYPVDEDVDVDDVYIPARRRLPSSPPPLLPPQPVGGGKTLRRVPDYSPRTMSPVSFGRQDPYDQFTRPTIGPTVREAIVEVPVYTERIVAVPATAPVVPKGGGTTCVQIVLQWDFGEVVNWLSRNNYSHLQNWFLGYTGEDLVGLKKIAAEAPEFFFCKLERDFGFKSLLEMIRFKKMLDDII